MIDNSSLSRELECGNCKYPLFREYFTSAYDTVKVKCGSCLTVNQIEIFPAIFKRIGAGNPGETAVDSSESRCFYHDNKKAVVPCSLCGRFLCLLCDIELSGNHYCPACLEKGKEEQRLNFVQSGQLRYDSIALALAVYPMLIFYFTFLTAPAAIYIAIKYWKKTSRAVIPRTNIRSIAAVIIASFEIIGWFAFIYAMVT